MSRADPIYPDFIELIEKARAEFKAGKTLSLEKMKNEVKRREGKS